MSDHFECSKCRYTKFRSYAQTTPIDGREWDYQYYCARCGQLMFLTKAAEEEECRFMTSYTKRKPKRS